MNVPCILGVDPGLKGAIAFYFPDAPDRVSVFDMPVVAGEVDPANLAALIRQFAPTHAVIELVHSMPKQGVSSAFKFGEGCGVVRGVISTLGISSSFVSPQRWKKHFRLDANKEKARREALRLFSAVPEHFQRVKDEGRAEASLIARYYAETKVRAAA